MSEFSYDVAVAYRVHPGMSSNRPPIFAEDKFKLTALCLKSLRESRGALRVKLWVILNECPPEYEALFRSIWPEEDLVLKHYSGLLQGATLYEESCILANQRDAELVYFAEDDYFFLPGQLPVIVDFLRQNADADFATCYEHPDLHSTELHRMKQETRVFGGRAWTTSMATTHAFMARRSALVEIHWIFTRFFKAFGGKTSPDLGMWMALTKKGIYNPFKILRWLKPHWHWAGSIVCAWVFCWRQILFGKRYRLWTPHPSIATHMIAAQLASGVDWQQAFQTQLSADASAQSSN